MTPRQTRLLFTSAALFNWGAVLLTWPLTGLPQALGLMAADNSFFDHIALLAVASFGYGYWLVAGDPARHRSIVVLGLWLKLGVVALGIGHYLAGSLNAATHALVCGDLVYAALFYLHLRGSKPAS
jgi:hypothetical protein